MHLNNIPGLFSHHIVKLARKVFRWKAEVLSKYNMSQDVLSVHPFDSVLVIPCEVLVYTSRLKCDKVEDVVVHLEQRAGQAVDQLDDCVGDLLCLFEAEDLVTFCEGLQVFVSELAATLHNQACRILDLNLLPIPILFFSRSISISMLIPISMLIHIGNGTVFNTALILLWNKARSLRPLTLAYGALFSNTHIFKLLMIAYLLFFLLRDWMYWIWFLQVKLLN